MAPRKASKKMHVVVAWTPQSPASHLLRIDREITLSSELNNQIAIIGNGGHYACRTNSSEVGCTDIRAGITKGRDKRLCISKLRDIVLVLAASVDVAPHNVTIELLGRMDSMSLNDLCRMITDTGGDYETEPETRQQRHNRALAESADVSTRGRKTELQSA